MKLTNQEIKDALDQCGFEAEDVGGKLGAEVDVPFRAVQSVVATLAMVASKKAETHNREYVLGMIPDIGIRDNYRGRRWIVFERDFDNGDDNE